MPITVTAEQAQRSFLHMWHQITSQELTRRHASATSISTTPRPSAPFKHTGPPVRPAEDESGAVKEQQYVGLIKEHQPLTNHSIRPEVEELASALRTLFASLDMTMRLYAARTYMNPSSLSRYLSGTRIPPRSFIEDLVHTVQESGVRLPQYAHDRLIELYENALRSSPTPATSTTCWASSTKPPNGASKNSRKKSAGSKTNDPLHAGTGVAHLDRMGQAGAGGPRRGARLFRCPLQHCARRPPQP